MILFFFNMILVWISIITSDCRPFTMFRTFCIFFIYSSNLYPFSIFLLHCWSFAHWFIETLYILGNLPIGFLYFDFINHVTYIFVYGVACHTFFFFLVQLNFSVFQLELQCFSHLTLWMQLVQWLNVSIISSKGEKQRVVSVICQ